MERPGGPWQCDTCALSLNMAAIILARFRIVASDSHSSSSFWCHPYGMHEVLKSLTNANGS